MKPVARGADFGDAAGELFRLDLDLHDLADVVARAPAAIADFADVQLARRRLDRADDRSEQALFDIVGRNAQRIGAALIRVADFLQRHADQAARVVFAADEVAFEGAVDVG